MAAVLILLLLVIERFRIDTRLTTHYLGEFPENLPAIVDAVKDARFSISILSDVFSYGAFSAPSLYEMLGLTLRQKKTSNKALEITWCAYSDKKAEASVRQQFALANITPGSSAEKEFIGSGKMASFTHFFEGIRPTSIEDFLEKVLRQMNNRMREDLRTIGCKVNGGFESDFPIYIFLVDRRLAVFSIHIRDGSPAREATFLTQDPVLLNVIEDVGKLYWKK